MQLTAFISIAATVTAASCAVLSSSILQPITGATTVPSSSQIIPSSTIVTPPSTTTPAGPVIGECIAAGKYLGTYHFVWNGGCNQAIADCNEKLKSTNYIWSKTSCVASAVCSGTHNIVTVNRCRNPTFPTAEHTAHLSYNIYANIVGDCAWQDGGCPITKQKFIDFYYGALSSIGATIWPDSVEWVVQNYWQPILDWTKTGETVPYTNFDDWLHYSNSA